MNERIRRLRERSVYDPPRISEERAALITDFYQSGEPERVSTPVARALAFRHIMAHKHLHVSDGELIVGERGPEPKATPTYPEVCVHSEEDLDILDGRDRIPYLVSSSVKESYRHRIIPCWKGRSMRDRIFAAMSEDWKSAYEAGVFTEFQEQRSPGHTALGDVIYRKGILDLRKDIQRTIAQLDFFRDPQAVDKREELRAMDIAAEGLVIYATRYATLLGQMASSEQHAARRLELEEMAEVCRWVPARAPRTFHEALQYYWFVHVGVITEVNPWDAFNPGRLDQHLYPFYREDVAAGRLSKERAVELLQSFWIKFNNQPAPPKVGVTAQESSTYTDFALINVGGVKPDGSDAVNELTYLILDVIEEMRMVQPSSMVQVSKKNPDRLLKRATRITRTGFGQPSFFNTDAIVQELVRQGKSLEDARCGGASGCVESGSFGREAYILSGYFNLAKILELTLHNGRDPRTSKQIGLQTGSPEGFRTFQQVLDAFEAQIRHFVDIKIRGNNIIERLYATHLPVPFLSLFIEDCIANGTDYHAGGARYNTTYIQGVGLGTVTDSLSAVEQHVYNERTCSMEELLEALAANFNGREDLRYELTEHAPKYGNDDDRADKNMRWVFDAFFHAVDSRPNSRGGMHRINMLPTTVHVYFGSVVGALPDGRFAGLPLSEGISPVQGADRNGPTSVLNSAAKLDHVRTGGTLLNQKFTPHVLADDGSLDKLSHLIRTYFRMDGHHIQFNVVDAATLREAQKDPEAYRDLIVRVAGYSDYFVHLGPELQEEIIRRTEHMEL